MKKNARINLRITAKPHAHVQTLSKTHVKFQNDQTQIVGIAFTRVDIFFDGQMDRHMDAQGIGGDIINNIECWKTVASGLAHCQIRGTGLGQCCKSSKHLRIFRMGTLNVKTL